MSVSDDEPVIRGRRANRVFTCCRAASLSGGAGGGDVPVPASVQNASEVMRSSAATPARSHSL